MHFRGSANTYSGRSWFILFPMTAWISEKRELTREERDLLTFLAKERAELLQQISEHKVIARCICGCRTVVFGTTNDDEPKERGGEEAAYYQGRAANGTLVGVLLNVDEGRIVELEGIGWDGEFQDWPAIDALKPT